MTGLAQKLLPCLHGVALLCGISVFVQQQAMHNSGASLRADYAAAQPLAGPNSPVTSNARSIHRASDGFFYVQAKLNGVPLRLLVDTGASVAVLTKADARRVGVTAQAGPAAGQLGTVGGHVAMSWTNVDAMTLGARRISNVRAAIVGDDLAVSLIGQNVLAQLSSIHIEGDEMRFE
jgi:aspartyl protease family protein